MKKKQYLRTSALPAAIPPKVRSHPAGHTPINEFSTKGRRPLSSIHIRSLYASIQARIDIADNRIKFYFFAEKYIFICVCAIFVVPL